MKKRSLFLLGCVFIIGIGAAGEENSPSTVTMPPIKDLGNMAYSLFRSYTKFDKYRRCCK